MCRVRRAGPPLLTAAGDVCAWGLVSANDGGGPQILFGADTRAVISKGFPDSEPGGHQVEGGAGGPRATVRVLTAVLCPTRLPGPQTWGSRPPRPLPPGPATTEMSSLVSPVTRAKGPRWTSKGGGGERTWGPDLGTGGGVWGRSLATDPTHREGAGAGHSRFTLQHPAGGPTGNQSVGDRDVTPEERRVPSASGDKQRIPSAPGGLPRTKHCTIQNHHSHWSQYLSTFIIYFRDFPDFLYVRHSVGDSFSTKVSKILILKKGIGSIE